MRSARLALHCVVAVAVLSAAATGGVVADHEPPNEPDGNVTVSVLEEHATVSDAAAVRRARADGSAFDPQYVLPGDRLLVTLRSSALTDAYAESEGPDPTSRLFSALNESDAYLSVAQLGVTPGRRQASVSLRQSDVRVVPDPANDTFSLVLDTEKVTLVAADGERLDRDLGYQKFRVALQTTENGSRRTSTADVRFEKRVADLRGSSSRLALNSSPAVLRPDTTEIRVNGTTTVRPNETVTVRAVDSNGNTVAASRVRTAAASDAEPHGPSTVEATVPVESVAAADAFWLRVERGGEVVGERPVAVGSPARVDNVSAELVSGGERDGQIRVTATARLPDEGLIVVADGESPTAVSVPEDQTVTRTVYANRSAVGGDGAVAVYAVWDRDGSGTLTDADEEWASLGGTGTSARVAVQSPGANETRTRA